ncbi:GAP family protein [Patescibacteria group bacterium]|nr:GAP family protein [Patescibacteria group bacterium]
MISTVSGILPMAIGVAISPVPIIAVILMLFSKKAKSNSLLFLLGWIVGLMLSGGIILILGNSLDIATNKETSTGALLVKLLLGVLLLFLAIKQWKSRPKEGKDLAMPKWMKSIDSFSSTKAFGLAFLLSAVNPKNLALTLAAAFAIAQSGLTTSSQTIVLAIFIVLASITVGIPVLINLVAGSRVENMLTTWKAWLTHNNATVMFILLLIFGISLVSQSVQALTR